MPGLESEVELERSPTALLRAMPGKLKRCFSFEWTILGIFTALLAFTTAHHEMWRDELQAWLIARDSHSLSQLFHLLHYEGHPALWYLLLWIPAHLSPNPAGMQVVNSLIAVALAWVVLSARTLPASVRVLILFSFFVFYQYGVTARSYELAFLLLFAAARCLTGGQRQRNLAIFLLALSLNTHAFAAPVAVALAAWAFYFAKLKSRRDAGRLLRDREFVTALIALGVAGMLALLTVWPAKDIIGPGSGVPSFSRNLQDTWGMLWLTFVPRLPSPAQLMLFPLHSSITRSCLESMAVLVGAAAILGSTAARIFFLSCALMETLLMAVTVELPSVYHLGFLFAAFLIALLLDYPLDADANPRPRWLSRRFSSVLVALLLLAQVVCTADASWLDWRRPFSDAKEASEWLRANHLESNPLVLQPSEFTTGIVAYLERPSAYYPSCRCYGSYELRNTARQLNRMATPEELRMVRGNSPLPVILISNAALNPGYLRDRGLVEIHATARNSEESDEIFYIYRQAYPR